MAANGIMVASQPNFSYSLGPYNASPAVTSEVLQTNNPQRSLRDHGIPVSFGSDGMPTGPLVGIYAAVTRRGIDGKVYGPEEAITLEEAIRSYTYESAYMTFDEARRGSIEPGKYADFVVLDADLMSTHLEDIMEVPVYQTIIGGVTVFSAER